MTHLHQPQRLPQIVMVLLCAGLAGCGVTSVQDIQAHPHRNWFTSTVYLRGTVGDRAPLLNGMVYQLRDSTGTIWVLTTETGLQTGEQVHIKGKVRYQDISIAGQELGDVYVEQQTLLKREGKQP